ncbi:MAG: hypothetical protein IIB83_05070 [Bacteroidetes bacterium]|nr:hypothetical protein [Bacteroidota bacterium]
MSDSQMMSLLVTGVGFTLAIASWGLLLLRKTRQTYELKRIEKMEVISDFLQFWNNFEIVSRDVLQREDKKFNKYSIREIIEILQEEGRLNRIDVLALDEAIRLRNSIVHRGDFISAERANKLMEVLNEVIQKLSSD